VHYQRYSIQSLIIIGSIFAVFGCATSESPAGRLPASGNDCFWANSIHDWRALDEQRLIVWSPGRSCAYRVDLAHRCLGLRFTDDIGFSDRDGRICSFGGDAVIVPGRGGDRCSIAAVTRLTEAEVSALVGDGPTDEPVVVTEDECEVDEPE